MKVGRGYVINVGRGYVINHKGRHRAARAAKNGKKYLLAKTGALTNSDSVLLLRVSNKLFFSISIIFR